MIRTGPNSSTRLFVFHRSSIDVYVLCHSIFARLLFVYHKDSCRTNSIRLKNCQIEVNDETKVEDTIPGIRLGRQNNSSASIKKS